MRRAIIATIVLLAVPVIGAAAVGQLPAEREQLVEGHTVFTVVEARPGTVTFREEFAAAVAVLVREQVHEIRYASRIPGVLWFNDQYLVNASGTAASKTEVAFTRYPCGAVIAVNAGDPLPQVGGMPVVPASAAYVESYRLTDPNGYAWEVDKWRYDPDGDALTLNSFLIWSVGAGAGSVSANSVTGYGRPDDGRTDCGTASDGQGCGYPRYPFVGRTPQEWPLEEERPDGYPSSAPWYYNGTSVYHDNGQWEGRGGSCLGDNADAGVTNPADFRMNPDFTMVRYNAVLYFFLDDLTDFGGVKDHAGADAGDENGCQPGHTAWPCPGGDDHKEGNSHRYNPREVGNVDTWPAKVATGRDNHGGSAHCGPAPAGGPQYQHATCNVDVYFGWRAASLPAVRTWRVYDLEGRTAPYHCHAADWCNEEDAAPGTL